MRQHPLLWCCAIAISIVAICRAGASTDASWFALAWQPQEGLPDNTVAGLAQTPDGYLWVAARSGLFRFDGFRFQEFAAGLHDEPSGAIRSMICDRRGRLWLFKDPGRLIRVEHGAVAWVFVLNKEIPSTFTPSITEDARGTIWLAGVVGEVFQVRDDGVRSYGVADGVDSSGPYSVAESAAGGLWLCQSGRVCEFRNGTFAREFELSPRSGCLVASRDRGYWLASGTTICKAAENGKVEDIVEVPEDAKTPDPEITTLFEDRFRRLWIGTASQGLFEFDSNGIRHVETSHPRITSICEDDQGDIWVGTHGGGLNRLRPKVVEVVGQPAGLPFAAAQSVCEDHDGALWVSGQNGAVVRRDQGRWIQTPTNALWSGGGVACMEMDPRRGVLAGTIDAGVLGLGEAGFTPMTLNQKLPSLYIRSLFCAPNGDLWIGLNPGGALQRLRGEELTAFPLPSGCRNVRAMAQDRNGDLWAATVDGHLLRVHEEMLMDETANTVPAPQSIRCLHCTEDGALWIGYAKSGLGWFKQGRYHLFQSAEGLLDQHISQILSDDRGRLWLGSDRGIFYVSLAELERVAEGRASSVRSIVFGREDGVPNLQATFGSWPASTRCRDGRLLMPMLTGLAVVRPDLCGEEPPAPPVIIESVVVNGRIVARHDTPSISRDAESPALLNPNGPPSNAKLSPGVRQMDFQFTALSLSSAENARFKYKLEGSDQDWVEAGAARYAHYGRIAPGNYKFHVIACNHYGIWNETGAMLALTVPPFFWETLWFRLSIATGVCVLLALGVMMAMRRRYLLQLERLEQQKALERERARIAQDLHDDLGAGLVEISFGSELALDSGLGAEDVREYTREIGARAREMVTALDEIVWAVNPKHDSVTSLATYFCQFAQHFLKATSIRCQLEVDRQLPAAPLNSEERHSLFLAFKEALSNLARHSGATELRLSIASRDGLLRITVSDNGKGFDPDSDSARNGDGLGNMIRRLQQLGGNCNVKSAPGEGTTVVFSTPLRRAAGRNGRSSFEVL